MSREKNQNVPPNSSHSRSLGMCVFRGTRALFEPIAIALVVGEAALVRRRHERRRNHEVGRGPVAGNRNVPDDSDPEQGFDVGIVRLRLKWIPEEDDEVDGPFRDLGADLLVTAERTALKFDNGSAEGLFQKNTGGAGGE